MVLLNKIGSAAGLGGEGKVLWYSGWKKKLKKEKKLKKSLDKEKEICPNGRLFHLKKGA